MRIDLANLCMTWRTFGVKGYKNPGDKNLLLTTRNVHFVERTTATKWHSMTGPWRVTSWSSGHDRIYSLTADLKIIGRFRFFPTLFVDWWRNHQKRCMIGISRRACAGQQKCINKKDSDTPLFPWNKIYLPSQIWIWPCEYCFVLSNFGFVKWSLN